MKKIYSIFLMITGWFSTTAQEGHERYKDSVFRRVDKLTVEYGSNINYTGANQDLEADIYLPADDSVAQRPLIVYMHGGGFRAGRRFDTACVELCKKLTRRGYVTASIDYRLGMADATTSDQSAAVIRAVQDLNAFIRYAKSKADSLGIDTSKIFITGSSAGGIAVLTKAYMKADSTAVIFGVKSINDLEGNTNQLPFTSSVAGVFSMWGALYNIEWLQQHDVPVGCVHSRGDSTIPFVKGYNRQNRSLLLYGSQSIYDRATSLGIPTFLHAYDSYKHDLGLKVAPYKDTTAQLIADFFYQLMQHEKKEQPVPVTDPAAQAYKDAIDAKEILNKHYKQA